MAEYSVGIRNLKTHLSQHIERVKCGQTVLITEHGRPVGWILPVSPEVDLQDRIERMRQTGLVAWNGERLRVVQPPATNLSGRLVSYLVAQMRE